MTHEAPAIGVAVPAVDPDAEARVRAVLDIAARVSDRDDPLGREAREGLERLGELSKEGVELALSRHVERADEADLPALLASVAHPSGAARRCWVVASANVCVAPVRAIALGLAASAEVIVKPSRRDPVLARLLVRELARAGLAVAEVERIAAVDGEVVHAYGADETLRVIAAALAPGVRFMGHGTGFGVAAVGSTDDLVDAAARLADDVIVFDQAGCLSPRMCFVEGDARRAEAFAHTLSEALDRGGAAVPRGPLGSADAAALKGYERTLEALGGALVRGPQHLVGMEEEPAKVWPGPGLRTVHIVQHRNVACAAASVATVAPFITAIGGAEGTLVAALRRSAPRARASELGAMQRPPLDGPVDRRSR